MVISQETLAALERLLKIDIPESLEELQVGCAAILEISRKSTPISSLVVAHARRNHFNGNPAGWIQWAAEKLHLAGSHLHHLRQCGDLMLAMLDRKEAKAFRILFTLESRKLMSLAQIDPADIPAFLSQYDVANNDRRWCANAVRIFLELPEAKKLEQPDLPGFEKAVEKLALFDDDFFVNAVKSPESSQKTVVAGLSVLCAGLEYQKRLPIPDAELLQKAKAALVAEIEEIELALAKCFDSSERADDYPDRIF